MLLGADLSGMRPVCPSILRSSDQDPGTGRLWIEATYTPDGKTVAALVSQDLSAEFRAKGCATRGQPGRCWLNTILAARSDDMGARFRLLSPPERTVATLGAVYPESSDRRFGVFTTSNIVRKDGFFFMIAFAQGEGVQKTGNCLFRSPDPLEPQAWRAWDGMDFTIDMRRADPPAPCTPLPGLTAEVRSLSWSEAHSTWIAVYAGRHTLKGDPGDVPGFYFATSSDLVRWSRPGRIAAAPIKPRESSMDELWRYPSLIDFGSPDRNFGTVSGDTATLLYTVGHLTDGRGSMNRDLVALPVQLGTSPRSSPDR